MEAEAGPGAAEPAVIMALYSVQSLLSIHRGLIELRVGIVEGAESEVFSGRPWRVQSDEDRRRVINRLQRIHPIGDAEIGIGIVGLDHIPR